MPSPLIRVYLVTGASRGLGRHTVEALASRPYTVVFLAARDLSRAADAAKGIIVETSSHILPIALDVSSDDSIVRAVETVKEELANLHLPPAISGLVNNAGVNTENHYSNVYTEETFIDTPHELRRSLSLNFEVNAFGTASVTVAFLPLLRAWQADRPVVVNLGSAMGSLAMHADSQSYVYPHKQLGYSSTKGFINHLTVFCSQVYPDVRFVSMHPGYLGTDMTAHNKYTADASTGIPHIIAQLTDTEGETGVFLGPSADNKTLVTYPW